MAYCFIERHINAPGTMWCKCGSLVAGTPVDGYNVISYIGHGTSGDVYLAEQPALNNRKVVIKIAHRSWHQSDIDNFRREAALLASLSHPYILPIYAYGVIHERQSPVFTSSPYLVLPYAEQGSLEEAFMQGGKRPWSLLRVIPMAQEIADALDYAHSRGVLHRDVKPANLLQMGIPSGGQVTHVLLSDFSVASLIDAEESHLNAPWAGSPAYMAPEVWRHSPGRYSDQYALAVTCFRLLAGEYPWTKMNEGKVQEWMHLHRYVPPRSLQEFRPNLPRALDLVLQRGMAKDPHERYPTVQAFASDLLDASEDRTEALGKTSNEVQLRPLPLDVQTAGKDWQNNNAPRDSTTDSVASPTNGSREAAQQVLSPVASAAEPMTEELKPSAVQPPAPSGDRNVENGQGTEAVSVRAGPAPFYQPDGESDSLVGSRHANRWRWYALVLVFNALICLLLAAEAYWQSKVIMSAINLLMALWPSLLVGLLLAYWFRHIRLITLSWGIFWGVFFGLTDVLLSGLVCYCVVALAQTIPHWGRDWLQPGDGLRIFIEQVVGLARFIWIPVLFGAWLAVVGGALIGVFIYNRQRTK